MAIERQAIEDTIAIIRDSLRVSDKDPSTFIWNERPNSHFDKPGFCVSWNKRFAGKTAGHKTQTSRNFSFGDVHIPGAVVSWVIKHDEFPANKLGFKDGNRFNIAADNLFEMSGSPIKTKKLKSWMVKFGTNLKYSRSTTTTSRNSATEEPVAQASTDMVPAQPVLETPPVVTRIDAAPATGAPLYSLAQIRRATAIIGNMDSTERELVKAILQDD